jgi:hypothetical protein
VGLCSYCEASQLRNGGKKVAYSSRYGPKVNTVGKGIPSSGAPQQCSFTWDIQRKSYAVSTGYDVNFIEFIKAKIPGSDRAWDASTKMWYIKEAWFDIMFELASQLWPGAVGVVSRASAEQAWKEQEAARSAMLAAQRQAVLGPLENAILAFCQLCDADALRAARNKMAIALHPDKGGSPEKMAQLNAAWFAYEQELKKSLGDTGEDKS